VEIGVSDNNSEYIHSSVNMVDIWQEKKIKEVDFYAKTDVVRRDAASSRPRIHTLLVLDEWSVLGK
jgi:hypothetical protein